MICKKRSLAVESSQSLFDNPLSRSKVIMTQTELDAQVKTCVSCPCFQPHDDGTDKGWCNIFDRFARASHSSTQDCVNILRSEQPILNSLLVEQQAAVLAPEFEVDSSIGQSFGILYRVWKSYNLLGTFCQDSNGRWTVQPTNSSVNSSFSTSDQAILVIIAIYENPQLQAA